MNRQAVAFLSLFSLVLVLSIYYVMLPVGISSGPTSAVNNIITNASDPYIESIVMSRILMFEESIDAQLEIAGSSEYTAAEKVKALETVEELRDDMNNEEELRNGIKSSGFPCAYVEIFEEENYINVLTISETKTDEEVLKIYDCVDALFLNNQIQVYVSFR